MNFQKNTFKLSLASSWQWKDTRQLKSINTVTVSIPSIRTFVIYLSLIKIEQLQNITKFYSNLTLPFTLK